MFTWIEVELVRDIRDVLRARSVETYVVGGYVRDALLGSCTRDIDFAVDDSGLHLAREVADELGGSFVTLDEERDVGRVVLFRADGSRLYVDFSRLRGGSLEADLALRDFTINAMAVPLAEVGSDDPEIVDPYGGRTDLEEGRVCAVSEDVFVDDPLRLLRAVRVAATLEFELAPHTSSLVQRQHEMIERASPERIRDELVQILILPGAADHIRQLDTTGLLATIMPELEDLKGLEQPPPHVLNVFDHTVAGLEELERILAALGLEESGVPAENLELDPVVDYIPELLPHLWEAPVAERPRYALIKLALLLHDIGKPLTKGVTDEGRIQFLGHAGVGASLAADILRRNRFGGREVVLVRTIVWNHMRPLYLSREEKLTSRAVYRFFRDTGSAGVDVLLIALADYRATHGEELRVEEWHAFVEFVGMMLDKYYKQREDVISPPKLIDGHDLMETFDLEPGPKIGHLLEAIREAQVIGEVETRAEALAYVKEMLEDESTSTSQVEALR